MIETVFGICFYCLLVIVVFLGEGIKMAGCAGCQPSEWANRGHNTVPPARYKPDITPKKQ